MPIPVAVAVGAGVVSGVATGYVIDKAVGDGNYTRNEMVTDAILGGAGIGFLKHGGKLATGHLQLGRKLRHFDRAKGDVLSDIPVVYLFSQGPEILTTGKTAASIVAVGKGVDVLSGQSLTSSPKGSTSATISKMKSGKNSKKRSKKKSRKFKPMRPQWCSKHGKYDYCYRK